MIDLALDRGAVVTVAPERRLPVGGAGGTSVLLGIVDSHAHAAIARRAGTARRFPSVPGVTASGRPKVGRRRSGAAASGHGLAPDDRLLPRVDGLRHALAAVSGSRTLGRRLIHHLHHPRPAERPLAPPLERSERPRRAAVGQGRPRPRPGGHRGVRRGVPCLRRRSRPLRSRPPPALRPAVIGPDDVPRRRIAGVRRMWEPRSAPRPSSPGRTGGRRSATRTTGTRTRGTGPGKGASTDRGATPRGTTPLAVAVERSPQPCPPGSRSSR
jgi:hypothetical protein